MTRKDGVSDRWMMDSRDIGKEEERSDSRLHPSPSTRFTRPLPSLPPVSSATFIHRSSLWLRKGLTSELEGFLRGRCKAKNWKGKNE